VGQIKLRSIVHVVGQHERCMRWKWDIGPLRKDQRLAMDR
jgi:hypothetical protein